jgi:hypothetical protein
MEVRTLSLDRVFAFIATPPSFGIFLVIARVTFLTIPCMVDEDRVCYFVIAQIAVTFGMHCGSIREAGNRILSQLARDFDGRQDLTAIH